MTQATGTINNHKKKLTVFSDYKFSAFSLCLSSHSGATEWVSSSHWLRRKLRFCFKFWGLVLCPAAKLALICPPAVAVVDGKAGVEAQSQRVGVKRTVYDSSCGGKPQLCCFKFCVMPHPQDGTFQYAFVQAAAEKKQLRFRQSQAKHWHLRLSHQ